MKTGVEMLPVTATLWLERAEKHNPILPTAGSPMLAAVAEEMEEYADRKVALALENGMRSYRLQQRAYLDEIDRLKAPTHPAATGSVRGWKLVPVEASDEMVSAGYGERGNLHPADAYRRMLAAVRRAYEGEAIGGSR
jgi:hypothetical protein